MTNTATFVMPYYADHLRAREFLVAAINGLWAQTDRDWQLIIVDDCSPAEDEKRFLSEIANGSGEKIFVEFLPVRMRQGHCRNVGIRWADRRGSEIILFNDADDISHPRRLEVVREIFEAQPSIALVYSTFRVIDENGQSVAPSKLTRSIAEILESHDGNPPVGPNAWVRIGTETGYTNLTSSTAVRTHVAVRHAFPSCVSEDCHTWYRISADGNNFAYTPSIPSSYRIPRYTKISSERSRVGPTYHFEKAKGDCAGFFEATDIAVARGALHPCEAHELRSRFLLRMSRLMSRRDEPTLANGLLMASKRWALISALSRIVRHREICEA